MKILTFFVVMLATAAANAQKIFEDKKNVLDGSRTISTRRESIVNFPELFFYVIGVTLNSEAKKDTIHLLNFQFTTTGETSIDTINKIIIKFSDGTIIERNYFGNHTIVSQGDVLNGCIKVDQDLEAKLDNDKTVKIWVETSEKKYDFTIKEKYQSSIKNALVLLKSTMAIVTN